MTSWLQQTPSFTNVLLFSMAAIVLLLVVLAFVTYAIYFERKVIGWMQLRYGPNRVGPLGLLQTVSDVVKLLIKEDTRPKNADRALFTLAPILAYAPAFAVLAVMPFTDKLQFADLGIGVLYYIALSGITVMGVITAGWASNNKYSLLGGMRSAAQMISYEVPLVMSVVGVVLMTGSLNLKDIVYAQQDMWNIIPQILGFGVFLIAAQAELNRSPFDLPEAESELVAGYHVEYSGFRFAMFMLSEYVYMFGMGTLITILFLGGWLPIHSSLSFIPPVIWFILKFMCYVFLQFWIRATMPRFRADQLMAFAWKGLLPIALLNILLTAVVISFQKGFI
ncbi:NADH-quinone oxidoreductase subunit NuoH [Brevibacillus laterosporus]|uniref:NADH-quinone oxidoreductase subunit H n=1 Tax=Brevibacillus laterosporus TaxID=1465 RepID=A0AAP8U5V2_BRELA|nr:NADH-quinone oxidoreductase subunit NuoH [Brevibacillus laterosporus]MBG9800558.1 NADH:ubiquinone oxidoreductase subunit H [Brevibacillus laterosporus]MCR8938853.1 NADH-quinone oxidoreductase subunit NuoH [Brevibacillus laterosporus]MCZ0841493.1 NADH-quinone oxidoreductase subunit NuoH [Brevibacillus laterosporus]MCZ0843849.1 NADH-quinone oxidoreductase subunit NuoH [Brevibacillus laterosporus]MED1662474.1 NADH-quinone oxidoreductase subunit NuoH [Brevibacillus laterosporus]